MTMINIGGEEVSSEMSANAIAKGADRNLVFEMSALSHSASNIAVGSFRTAGLPTIDRPLQLRRDDITLKSRVGTTHVGSTSEGIVGYLRHIRGATQLSQFKFEVPAAGQIPAVVAASSLVANPSSTVVRNTGKIIDIKVVRKDAVGLVPGGVKSQWLGVGSSRPPAPIFELFWHATETNIGSNAGTSVTLVPYDKLADKESAPWTVNLEWPMGPFVGFSGANPIYTIGDASGTLPQGTIVNFKRVIKFPDGTYISNGDTQNFTIGASGGVTFNPVTGGTPEIFVEDAGVTSKMRINFETLYKLATQSSWTSAGNNNGNQIIANNFAEGGIANPGTSYTLPRCVHAELLLSGWGLPEEMLGASFGTRFEFKMFNNGRLVAGTGESYTPGGNGAFPYQLASIVDSSGLNSSAHLNIGEDYANQHLQYAAATPRGDEYYTAGENINVALSIPGNSNVTALDIYIQEYTTTNGVNKVESNPPHKLIYSGPVVETFNWTGAVINPAATYPSGNTTDSYPAVQSGTLSWPTAITGDTIDILPGDQLFAELTNGSLPTKAIVSVTIPLEFI